MACITPFYKKGESEIGFPCGKCPDCLSRRASGWSFRLMKEYERVSSACFLTLTYITEHVPLTPKGFMSLSKRDIQLFMKRLRKAHPKGHPKIKYYAVGEYGEHNWRPHYHIILFNAKEELICKAWNLGMPNYGTVCHQSVGYTLKYMCKPKRIPQHQNDDRLPEFSLMSKGLGDNYITPAMVHWHKADLLERMYIPLLDGKKISMPRYYKDKIYDDDWERPLIANASAIKARMRQDDYEKEMARMYGDHDWRRVKAQTDFYTFKEMYRNAVKNRSL